MRTSCWLVAVGSCALLAGCAHHEAPRAATGATPLGTAAALAPTGALVIAGGGDLPETIHRRALALAGGPELARVLVIPQASALPDAGTRSVERWRELGVRDAAILDLGDLAAAERAVRAATLVWIGGGDQTRLMDALLPTNLPGILRERYQADRLVVGGSSAGAAVMSEHMIRGGDDADLRSVTGGATKTSPGLGLVTDAIVDQHFLRRQRFNRLLSAVLDRPALLGVGIDESTAVVLAGGAWEVVGSGCVLFVDARGATEVTATPGQLSTARDVRLHLLQHGQRYLPAQGAGPER